jgi:N-acetylmuramoyl-L-alanine amidase
MKAGGLKRRVLLQGGSIALMLGVHQIARGATILAVRVWPAADYTRVTIESDARLSSQQLVVGSPPRLAVDIEGIELNTELRELVGKIKPGDPYINGLRVGQNAPTVVRIVFDLKQTVRPQVFSLAPVAAYKHRLVLDLYPEQAIDPMEALIAERLRDARQVRQQQQRTAIRPWQRHCAVRSRSTHRVPHPHRCAPRCLRAIRWANSWRSSRCAPVRQRLSAARRGGCRPAPIARRPCS